MTFKSLPNAFNKIEGFLRLNVAIKSYLAPAMSARVQVPIDLLWQLSA